MTIEELAKEYANKHLDVSEELGTYLVKSVFLDGAEYQREKQDGFAIEFADWLGKGLTGRLTNGNWIYNMGIKAYTTEELLEKYKKEKGL
jgi:hypothetical protein